MDSWDNCAQAEWLVWSGLPQALNELRAGSWPVFQAVVQLDCRSNRRPDAVEVSIEELAMRTGLDAEKIPKILEALRKRGYLRLYLPEHPGEAALIEIKTPIATPLGIDETAKRIADPQYRDKFSFRYARANEETTAEPSKVQAVVDMYLDHLSQKMNGFILEQCEIAARRFPLELIREIIERGERHNVRAMGWVIKELIREQRKRQAESKRK